MKISKILAGMSAAAIAATMMSFATFAADDTVTGTDTSVVADAGEDTSTVWTGSVKLGADWSEDNAAIPGTALKDVTAGDKLVLKITPTATEEIQLKVCSNVPNEWGTIFEKYDIAADATEVEISIDAAVLEKLKTVADSTIAIQGKNVEVTSLEVKSSKPVETVAWTGSNEIGNWANALTVEADKFANIKAGDVITVKFKTDTIEGEDWNQIKLQDKDGKAFEGADCVDIKGKDEFSLNVTAEIAEALKADGLGINGHAFTATEVSYFTPAAPIISDDDSSEIPDDILPGDDDTEEVKPLFNADATSAKVLFDNWASEKDKVTLTGATVTLEDGTKIDVPMDELVVTPGNDYQYTLTLYEVDEETGDITGTFADDDVWQQVTAIKFNIKIDEEYLGHVLNGDEGYWINGGVAVQSNGIWPDWTKWAIGAAEDDESVAIRVEPEEDGDVGDYYILVGAENVNQPEDEDPGDSDSSKPDESSEADDSSKKEDEDPNANPDTGATAALAAVGVALAGAAIVVSKKRK